MEETSNDLIDLPPGFRFHPTDEEIITHYLAMKVMDEKLTTIAMGEVDLNKCEPWDLPKKAKMKGKEWFFFCQRDRKYPTGMRTNRATSTGYWKATGKDREIYMKKSKGGGTGSNRRLIGMKKTLVFYIGRAPKGEKTNWVMHEYRLQSINSYCSKFPKGVKSEWVVCKVFHKNNIGTSRNLYVEQARNNDEYCNLRPPLMEDNIPSCSTTHMPPGHDEEEEEFKAASLSKSAAEEASIFSNTNFNLSFPISSYPNDVFNIVSNNQPFSDPIFLDYQTLEYQNSSVSEAAAAANEQYCKVEELSSNNNSSMVNVNSSQNTEISSFISNMQDLEYLWDY